nr:NACHT domain-containing protein [uncultured Actinoplanes sp.]
MSSGWERLLTSDFSSGTFGNLLANLISSAAVEIYGQWRKRLDEKSVTAGISRVREAARSLLVEVREEKRTIPPPIREFTGLPDSADAVAQFQEFMQTRDFEFVVSDVVAECILEGSVQESSIQYITLTLRLHALPGLPAVLIPEVARDLAGIIVLVVERSTRHDPSHTRNGREARAYLTQTAQERLLRRLDVLTHIVDTESKNITNVEGNLAKLRKSVATVHSTMRPPSVETAKKVPVDELYVGPTITLIEGRTQYRLPDRLPMLLAQSPRLVVLGNPGGGKTSFVTYLSYVTSTLSTVAVPYATVPIVLREHAAEVSASGGLNLLRAAVRTAHAKFQVQISEFELEYLCLHGRILFLIDGLDELLDLEQRIIVASAVEAFAALYPDCRVIVTSRKVGYDMAGIDRRAFTHATLAPFDKLQVREYVEKWFQQAEDLTRHMRESFLDSFIAESESIPDLRENPLMLSLLCGLYRHQRFIPSNRPELYEKCSTLLFDTWDRRRRLRPRFEFDAHVKLAIQHLALWIFTDQERQAGVKERDLVVEAARYFHEWLYDDNAVAMSAAQDFVNFCRNRAWVLTDTGTAAGGSPLFQFTHRTFLEYFAALHLNHTLSDSELLEVLVTHCADSPWHVVSQILVQLAWQRRQGLADKIVQEICRTASDLSPTEQAVVDALCVRTIESTPLKPDTVRAVVQRAMSQFASRLRTAPIRSQMPEEPVPGRESFWIDSSRLAVENYRAARPVVVKALADSLATSQIPLREASHLIEFGLTDDCSPQELRQAIPSDAVVLLEQNLSRRAPEAWIECSALLLQVSFNPSGHRGMLLGNRLSRGISPVKSMWGNRDLPNGSEIVSWLLVHDQLGPRSPALSACENLSRNALRHMKDPSLRGGYSPHPIWNGLQQVEETISSQSLPTFPLLLLLALIEAAVADCATEDEEQEMVFHLVSQPWGRCTLVPYLIATRYRLKSRAFSFVLRREAEAAGVDKWSGGTRPSAVELSSVLRP